MGILERLREGSVNCQGEAELQFWSCSQIFGLENIKYLQFLWISLGPEGVYVADF